MVRLWLQSELLSAIDKGYPVIYLWDAVSGLSPETEKEARNNEKQ